MPDPGAVTISSDLRPADRDAIVDGLVRYNAAHGFPWPWRDLDLVLRDGAGAVYGGALGETNAGWLFLKALWVDERLRGQGFGRRLLAAVEDGARARGCRGVYLDTYSFQARPFYERAGYTVFGALPDHPPGGAKYYMAKRLDPSSPESESRPGANVRPHTAARAAADPRAVEIRPAIPEDAESIAALIAAVQALHAAARPRVFKPAGADTFPAAAVRELMARPDRLFLVAADKTAVDRAAVLGCAHAEVQRPTESAFRYAADRLYVHHMAVRAEWRGRGIGTRLLEALGEAARAHGLGVVALDVWAFNGAARRFYARAGFVPEREVLALHLDRPAAPRPPARHPRPAP